LYNSLNNKSKLKVLESVIFKSRNIDLITNAIKLCDITILKNKLKAIK